MANGLIRTRWLGIGTALAMLAGSAGAALHGANAHPADTACCHHGHTDHVADALGHADPAPRAPDHGPSGHHDSDDCAVCYYLTAARYTVVVRGLSIQHLLDRLWIDDAPVLVAQGFSVEPPAGLIPRGPPA